MKFKIPLTVSGVKILKRKVANLSKVVRTSKKTFSSLEVYLKSANAGLTKDEYLAVCLRTFAFSFALIFIIAASLLALFNARFFYLYGLALSLVFSLFAVFSQLSYPRIYSFRKAREIEKNLIPAMQDMLVQLNSGVPLFSILVNLAGSNYSGVSEELADAVEEINSGKPQVEALDELANRNISLYFKRVLWQLSNGMRAGSDMSIVIKDSIDTLEKEQAVQIQNYGNTLNPLVMFYMLLTIIMPALALTFFTIISSMLSLSSFVVKMLFIAIFIFVVLFQIMFLGMIRTRRPSLL